MFTQICKIGAGFGLILSLAACDPSMMGGTASKSTTLSTGGARFAIEAPTGFCIDRASQTASASGAFVLLGDCALLGNSGLSRQAPMGAAITVSVSSEMEQTSAETGLLGLREYLATPRGLARLGRSGQATGVRIISTKMRNGGLFVLVEDRGRQPIAGVDRRFWRAFLTLKGHLSVMTMVRFEGSRLSNAQGYTILAGMADRLQAQNGN